jgi:hypothetical protein
LSLAPHRKHQINDLHVKLESIKLPEENMGESPMNSEALAIRARPDRWNY